MANETFLAMKNARVLLTYIPDVLDSFYVLNRESLDIGFKDIMSQWLFVNRENLGSPYDELTMETLLCYVIDNKPNDLSEREYLQKLEKKKINAKDYFFSKIKKEYTLYMSGHEEEGFIKKYYSAANNPYLKQSVPLINKDDIYNNTYSEILDWKRDSASMLFQFKFFSVLPIKKKCEWFLTELSIFAYNTICNDFYNNASGYVTKTPPLIWDVGGAVVSWASEMPELNVVMDEPGMFSVYESIMKDADGCEVIAEIDRIPTSAVTPDEIEKEKLKILSEYASGKRSQTFDTTDWRIYTTIFSMMRFGTFSDGVIHATLPELFSEIYPLFSGRNHLKREYVNLLERLDKISHRTLSSTSLDEFGRAVRQKNITFFTFDYELIGVQGASTVLSFSELKKKLDFNAFNIKELECMQITITPSSHMKQQWMEMKYKEVLSSDFKKLEESKDQVVLQILQEFRIKIFPERECLINYQEIETNIRTLKIKTTRLRKEIRNSIERIAKINSIIEAYEFNKTGINMTFRKLSDAEMEAFHFTNED